MNKSKQKIIEDRFRDKVRKDPKVNNAYLLVDSKPLGLHLNIAEGMTDDMQANSHQPNYMASVGKLFTSTIISILYEKGKLSFDDKINKYLDEELLDRIHIYKNRDYSDDIRIRHLLNQTSGLYDNFWPLLEKLLQDRDFNISPREAVIWGKENLKSAFSPGKKVKYTDTNYHLLGLIIENITDMAFHEVLNKYIFTQLDMRKSSMLHYSEPMEEYEYPLANFSLKGKVLNDYKGLAGIDFSGGGVVSTTEDLLKFMRALARGKIISKDTLRKMKKDSAKLYFGIEYGYGIWQFKSIPILLPKKYSCWGCVGAIGSFMFYHPTLDAYIIGNFNDSSYTRKSLKFVIELLKILLK